ncbi:MAG: TatD family hydrolase [Sedimentisphaerales bacterium]|nr:TatD family hydrolase [Sedimentisphaerales bacterium]
MELIDTHAHLTFDELVADVDQVLSRSRLVGVRKWITVGTDSEHNRKAVELTRMHEGIFAAVGIHPHHAKDVTSDDMALLRELAQEEKVVAIGETGLDFHYNFSRQDAQRQIFRAQLDMAAEFNLPVVVHCRNAFEETLAILTDFTGKLKGVVFHCYSEGAPQAEALLERGYFLSFTGIVTFNSGNQVREAAAIVPTDRMMIETDCPYISPVPVRNQRPCEPALLIHTAQKIAEIKQIPLDRLALELSNTSKTFFGIS